MSYQALRDPPWMSGPPDPEPRCCDSLHHLDDCAPDEDGDCECPRCTCDDRCPCECDDCAELRAYINACEPDPNEGCEDHE